MSIPEGHELRDIPQRESKSMRRRRIFSLLDCGPLNGIASGPRMAIDSPANDFISFFFEKTFSFETYLYRVTIQ